MRLLLLNSFLVLLSAGVALGQPTLTAAGINPQVSEKFLLNVGNYVSPGSAGANQTWNLAGITMSSTQSQTAATVGSSPYASSFPNANIQLNDGNVYQFLNVSNTAYKIAGAVGQGITFSYSDQEDLMHYPFNMGDNFIDTWGTTFTSNSVTFVRTGSVSINYDGWGTLITPSGTFPNVARLHMVEDYKDTYSMGSITYKNDEYIWFSNGYHQPLAAVYSLTNSLISTPTQAGLYLTATPGANTTGVAELFSVNSHIIAYPNPASDICYISTMLDRITTLELFNIEGKLIYEEKVAEGNTPIALDVRKLSDGIYMARLHTANGKTETKRINVLK